MRRLLPVLLVTLLLSGCLGLWRDRFDSGREALLMASVNGYADIYFVADPGASVRFSTSGGQIVDKTENRAIWQAPSRPGEYRIEMMATIPSRTIYSRWNIKVVEFPLVVLESTVVSDGLSGKDVKLHVFNASDKTVTGFHAKVLMMNNLGQRVSFLGDYQLEVNWRDVNLRPLESQWFTWSLPDFNLMTKVLAYTYEVSYSDGTVLRLSQM